VKDSNRARETVFEYLHEVRIQRKHVL